MHGDDGTALHEECGHLGSAFVEYTAASGPTLSSCVDVGTGSEQDVDGAAVTSLHRGKNRRKFSIVNHGLVKLAPQFGMLVEHSRDPLEVTGADRCGELLLRCKGQRVYVLF